MIFQRSTLTLHLCWFLLLEVTFNPIFHYQECHLDASCFNYLIISLGETYHYFSGPLIFRSDWNFSTASGDIWTNFDHESWEKKLASSLCHDILHVISFKMTGSNIEQVLNIILRPLFMLLFFVPPIPTRFIMVYTRVYSGTSRFLTA